MRYYDAGVCGFSIPTAEHSIITSWGRDNEVDAYRNMLKQFAKPSSLVAVVSDSYDIYKACELWGTELKQQIIDSGATVVLYKDNLGYSTGVEDWPQCVTKERFRDGKLLNTIKFEQVRANSNL
jgi:nicotinic acid phosphoribosyltransferase